MLKLERATRFIRRSFHVPRAHRDSCALRVMDCPDDLAGRSVIRDHDRTCGSSFPIHRPRLIKTNRPPSRPDGPLDSQSLRTRSALGFAQFDVVAYVHPGLLANREAQANQAMNQLFGTCPRLPRSPTSKVSTWPSSTPTAVSSANRPRKPT
jgi:hypothetical protein